MSFPTRIYGKYGWEKLTTTSKKHQLGTIMEFRDGRLFRYCFSNGALDAGRLVSGRPLSNASHDSDLVLAAAVALGGTTVTLTNAAVPVVADQFNDGLLFVNDDGSGPGGEGMLYRIKTSSVATTTGTITVVIDEEDGIAGEALVVADSQFGLIENEHGESNLWDANAIDGVPNGWTQVPVADNEYFWACSHGPTMALYDADDNAVRGRSVIPSITADGAIRGYDLAGTSATDNQTIGFAMVVSVDAELFPIFATID